LGDLRLHQHHAMGRERGSISVAQVWSVWHRYGARVGTSVTVGDLGVGERRGVHDDDIRGRRGRREGEREDGDEEGALHPSPFSKTRIQLPTASQSIAASQSSLRSASSRRATASVTAKQGLAVTNYAQAQDVDTISVTKATAGRYHLSSI